MPASVVGVVTLDIASATPGPIAIEVPDGAQGVVLGFSCYYNAFSCEASFAGDFEELPSVTSNIRLLVAPVDALGSQTITPNFGSYVIEGPTFFVAFISGIDNSSVASWVRDGLSDDAELPSLTIESTESDLVLAIQDWWTGESGTPGPPPVASGWSSVSTHSYNDRAARLQASNAPGAATTTFPTQSGPGGNYSRLALISLIGASGGGTETDLTVADMAHAHSLGAVALAAGSVLATADLSHAQSLDAVMLSTGTRITPADLTHAHNLDAVALTVDAEVAPADMQHGHALDAVALSVQVSLAIADLVHAHALEAVTLSTEDATTLAVADMLHAHTLESFTLSAQVLLAVQDLTHAHRLDTVSLSTVVGLVVARLVHGHALEAVVLDDVPALAVADMRHAHALESPALSALATLMVADMLHAHRLEGVTLSGGDVETERALVVRGRPRNWIVRGSRRNWRIQ